MAQQFRLVKYYNLPRLNKKDKDAKPKPDSIIFVDSAKVERDLTGITVDDGFICNYIYTHIIWPPQAPDDSTFQMGEVWQNAAIDYWTIDVIVGYIKLYPNVCSLNPSRRLDNSTFLLTSTSLVLVMVKATSLLATPTITVQHLSHNSNSPFITLKFCGI